MIGIKAVGFDPLTARKIHIISTVGSKALSTWVRGGKRIFTTNERVRSTDVKAEISS